MANNNNYQLPNSNHHFNYRNAVVRPPPSAMPPTVASRGMPLPPKDPPPSSTKFLSKYRPGYNMTATNTSTSYNSTVGGGSMMTSSSSSSAVSYRIPNNPALEFSSSNGFDGKPPGCNNVPSKPLQPPPNPAGILKTNPGKDWQTISNPPFKVDPAPSARNETKAEGTKASENELVVLPKLQIPQSEDPPAKPIQLWSKNQIAVEYDSDSETAAAPTTNRLMGKHEWKGPMAKKTKNEKPKKKSSSSSKSSASKVNMGGNAKGANDLKGIVSYYESEESDSSESGIIFPKGCKPEPSLKSRDSNASKSKESTNAFSNQDETAVSFTMKSQTNSVPKPAVFNEQEDEMPKRPLPKVKLPPPKLSPVAKSPPKPVAENTNNVAETQNTSIVVNDKDETGESKTSGDGTEETEDEDKQKSRSRSKKRSKKRSRSRSQSDSRSVSSSSDSSRSSYRKSRSYSSDSYSRKGSSSSSYSSYSSRSRSRSSSYRKSRRRKRSSSRRRRRRSDSYSDSNSRSGRRYFPSRSQQGGKKKRRKRNKKRRITRAPNPPFQQRNKSQMPPQLVAPQKLAHNNAGKMNNSVNRHNPNQASNSHSAQHGSEQINSDPNHSGAKNGGGGNLQGAQNEDPNCGPDQQIIGPQLPKPSGYDEFIAHTRKLGVNVDEEELSLNANRTSNDGQQGKDGEGDSSPFVPPSNIPNFSEEEKQKYSDLMNRLNSHIQQREQTSSVDINGSTSNDGTTANVMATQNAVLTTGVERASGDTSPQQQALHASPSLHQVVQQQQHQQQQTQHLHQYVQPQTQQYLYVPTSQLQLFPSSAATPNLFLPQQPTLLNPLLAAQSLGSLGGQLPLMSLNSLPLAAGIPTLGHHSLLGGGFNTHLLNSHLINPGLAAMSSQHLAALYAQLLNQNSNSNS